MCELDCFVKEDVLPSLSCFVSIVLLTLPREGFVFGLPKVLSQNTFAKLVRLVHPKGLAVRLPGYNVLKAVGFGFVQQCMKLPRKGQLLTGRRATAIARRGRRGRFGRWRGSQSGSRSITDIGSGGYRGGGGSRCDFGICGCCSRCCCSSTTTSCCLNASSVIVLNIFFTPPHHFGQDLSFPPNERRVSFSPAEGG